MRTLSALFSIATLLGNAAAQTTWTVPNGANLLSFIANAAPGDVLLLGTSHPGFQLDKGLVLRPASGRTTTVAISFFNIPAGQHATLADIDFVPATVAGFGPMGASIRTSGSVALDRCTITSVPAAFAPHYGVLVEGGSLTLTACTVTAAGGATSNVTPLGIVAGICSAVDCTFLGGNGTGSSSPTSAAGMSAGTLIASRCTFTAGTTSAAFGTVLGPVPGLYVGTNATAFLTDCTATGGSVPATAPQQLPGASAIDAAGTAYVARCTLFPGTGFPAGTPTSGNAIAEPAQVGITSTGPLLLGTTATITAMSGSSGQPLAFAFWPALGVATLPPVVEPLWGPAATAVLVNLTLPLPNAPVPFPIAVPNVPALANSSLWLQALQLDWPAVRASAVVGGMIR